MKDVFKDQIIEQVAIQLDQPTSQTKDIINTFLDLIKERLASGDKVVLIRFGSFEVRTRKGRTGRDPHTHQPIPIKEHRLVRFKSSTTLRRIIRKDENNA